jgi:tRNA U34 2-thiouridine synthase MnmA/TrmU
MPQDDREVCLLCRHDVFGVFMRNWDESEEKGNDNCTVEADFTKAQSVCQHLGIPLHEVDFVRQYWTQVFSDFIAQVSPHGS